MPDLNQFKYLEKADKFLFIYLTSSLKPDKQTLIGMDGAKRDYLLIYLYIPYEKMN